jgi:hypothetical protein
MLKNGLILKRLQSISISTSKQFLHELPRKSFLPQKLVNRGDLSCPKLMCGFEPESQAHNKRIFEGRAQARG